MKVLVTGATGFIGNHVVKELVKRNISVIATSCNEEKARLMSWFNKVYYVPFDIASKKGFLLSKFDTPDVLIHLAWTGLPNYDKDFHIKEELPIQLLFLSNLIASGIKNINIAGTCMEYGLREGQLNEEMSCAPTTPYAIAKIKLYQELIKLQNTYELKLKWLRLFYTYGEGQNEKSIIPQLQKAITEGRTSFNMSLGEQIRDYLPVSTVAKYIVDCSLQDELTGVINISSNNPIKIVDLVKEYLFTTKQTISLNLGFYNYPTYEPFQFWGDNSKLLKIIK